MKIKEIMNEFVEECKEKLDISCILQFGSSTYTDNFEDIDLILFFRENTVSSDSIKKLKKIIKNFEEDYQEIVFDFGGIADRKRKGKYSITVLFIGKKELNVEHNPHDLFFLKNLSQDSDIKNLYGQNPLENKKINLTKQHLFEMLSVDQKHALRNTLDDLKSKEESYYFMFKTFLRAMLIHRGHFKKEELLKEFQKEYGDKIRLPENSEDTINHKIKKEDFEDILKFAEDCLRYLSK